MCRTLAMTSLIASATLLGHAGSALGLARPTAPITSAAQAGHAADPQAYTMTLWLSGYSPVSYLDKNKAEPGSPRYAAEHDGITYFFTSDSQRLTFEQSPERYLPAYGGYCAFGCSVDAKFIPDPTSFRIIDGRTHLFLKNADVDAKRLWDEASPADVRAKAERFWASQNGSKAYIHGRNVPASGIGLDGYSPVSYFTVGRPEKGDPRFAVEHNGVTYYLTSQDQVELFKKTPDRFEPRCGGWCAFGMTVEDKFPVDPTKYRIIDGGLYLFLNNEQIDAFELWGAGDQRELVKKAQTHWKKVSGQ